MIGVYLSALAICAGSLLVGAALCSGDPRGWTWTAPAVGFAALLVLASLAIRLPGAGTTAAVALGIALVGSAARVARPSARASWSARAGPLIGLPVAIGVLAVAGLPFAVNGRVGLLGPSFNDDLAFHLPWIAFVRGGESTELIVSNYPLGPHSLVAALSQLTGSGIETAFLGLLLAVPTLTALTALSALEALAPRLRVVAAGLVGLPYLGSAYLAQGSFKEPILALLLLGFVLVLRDVVRGSTTTAGAVLAGALLCAATVYVFSFAGIVWPLAAVCVFGVAHSIATKGLPSGQTVRRFALPATVAAVVLVVLLLGLERVTAFFDSEAGRLSTAGDSAGAGGNYIGELWELEALGVWPSADFRRTPSDKPFWQATVALAALVAAYGAVWWVRARDLAVPAGVVSALMIYAALDVTAIPYLSGKALVVVAPLVMLMAAGGLLAFEPKWRGPRRSLRRVGWALGATAFIVLAAGSSVLALRAAAVRGEAHPRALSDIRSVLAASRTLALVSDRYAFWELRRSRVASFGGPGAGVNEVVQPRPLKRGRPSSLDFDSLEPGVLDEFRYVVGPRTSYASSPPPNFRPRLSTRWYVLWERHGPTPERQILEEAGAPGAILDCGRPPGAALSRRRGRAYVRPSPIGGSATAWRAPGVTEPARGPVGPATVNQGGTLTQVLDLPAGKWDLSLQYSSPARLSVRGASLRASLPPHLTDPGSFYSAGTLTSRGGRVRISVTLQEQRRLEPPRGARIGAIAATRVDQPGRLIPLRRACGRYVDWYVLR